jgi:hypothetical protein
VWKFVNSREKVWNLKIVNLVALYPTCILFWIYFKKTVFFGFRMIVHPKSASYKKKYAIKTKEESFRFEKYFIRDVLTVEATIIKLNNLQNRKQVLWFSIFF